MYNIHRERGIFVVVQGRTNFRRRSDIGTRHTQRKKTKKLLLDVSLLSRKRYVEGVLLL